MWKAGLAHVDNLLIPSPKRPPPPDLTVGQLHFAPTGVSEANLKASGVVAGSW